MRKHQETDPHLKNTKIYYSLVQLTITRNYRNTSDTK